MVKKKSTTVLFGVFLLAYGDAAQWSTSLTEGATIDACAGDANVTFPWEITLAAGETVNNVEWLYDGQSEELIATFTHGNFFSMPAFSQRVQRTSDTGLTMEHVTESDAGRYIVEAIVRDAAGNVSTLRHTAVLVVSSVTTATSAATLMAKQTETAVYDNQTGQYHVQLTCTSQDRPPPRVIWTDPSGASHVVSPNANGEFRLLVPNPVSGGNYTCRIHPDSPAARCLPRNASVLGGATVHVDRVDARLALLEADNTQLVSSVHDLQTENAQLKNQINDLTTKRVAFYARISDTHVQLNAGDVLVLPRVGYNQGDGYSSTSGVFTAPYSGTYSFLVSTVPYSKTNSADVYLKVDGSVVNECFSFITGDSASCNAVLHLRAGQKVWVTSLGSGVFVRNGTMFSGFLLYPDP